MRIYLKLTPNDSTVPFDYQYKMVGTFHKWLGRNKQHDDLSLYSISSFFNAEATKTGLNFPDGAGWFISFYDVGLAKKVLKGILEEPDVFYGMKVTDAQIKETPKFGSKHRFLVASPILVKFFNGKFVKHLIYSDETANSVMAKTLRSKMDDADLNDLDIKVEFDRKYPNAKTKLITINKIKNRASLCPVIISGSEEAVSFAWDVGVGHSTGCGFGALY